MRKCVRDANLGSVQCNSEFKFFFTVVSKACTRVAGSAFIKALERNSSEASALVEIWVWTVWRK